MGACACGYTTDPEKNCNGTHNVVKAVKADIIAKLEANGHADAAETLKAKQNIPYEARHCDGIDWSVSFSG